MRIAIKTSPSITNSWDLLVMYSVYHDLGVDPDCVKAHDISLIYNIYRNLNSWFAIKFWDLGSCFHLLAQAMSVASSITVWDQSDMTLDSRQKADPGWSFSKTETKSSSGWLPWSSLWILRRPWQSHGRHFRFGECHLPEMPKDSLVINQKVSADDLLSKYLHIWLWSSTIYI